jgi:hypothetical protein
MKVVCGGLQGLQQATQPADEVGDVRTLVLAAVDKFGTLDALPYSQFMPMVAAFDARHRRR